MAETVKGAQVSLDVDVTMATWDDAPHISPEQAALLWNASSEEERDARSRGIPFLGAGNIYNMPKSKLGVERFPIPDDWLRCYAMDPGWKATALLYFTQDPETSIYYVYEEYKKGKLEPHQHKKRFETIDPKAYHGVIDAAANTPNQIDGKIVLKSYRALGLSLTPAARSLEGGILHVKGLINTGQMFVFDDLTQFWKEYGTYRRDMNGLVPRGQNDHLMDCWRYFALSGTRLLKRRDVDEKQEKMHHRELARINRAYMRGHWMN